MGDPSVDMPRRAIVQLGLAGLVLTGCSVKVVENVEPFRLGVTNAAMPTNHASKDPNQ